MEIHFATWLFESAQGGVLTNKKASNRLLSFFFLKESGISKKQLKKYIGTGKLSMKKSKT